jgi:hypothetical protein
VLLEVMWWLPEQEIERARAWLCRARGWKLRAPLSGSQGQPSSVGSIQGPGRERRVTRELLSALRVPRAPKPGVGLALRVESLARPVRVS